MSIEHPHTTGLDSGAHHWHLVGSSPSAGYLDCCGCGGSMIVDATEDGGRWLRYSLMDGADLVGRGRGLLMADCPAGTRRLSVTFGALDASP